MDKWLWDETNEEYLEFSSDDGSGRESGSCDGSGDGVNPGGDGATLFVDHLPNGFSQVEVQNFLQENIPNAQNVRVPMEIMHPHLNMGFAFVELGSDADITSVINQVSNLEMGDVRGSSKFLRRKLKIQMSRTENGGLGGSNFGADSNARNSVGGGFRSENSSEGETTLYVGGIPKETSETVIRDYLLNKIPNAKNVRVPVHSGKGTTKGIAFVQLPSGINVKDVLKQVKLLSMGAQKLRINESKPREGGRSTVGSQSRVDKSYGGDFNDDNSTLFFANMKIRDQQKPSFSSIQNKKKKPTQHNVGVGRGRGRNTGRVISERNFRNKFFATVRENFI